MSSPPDDNGELSRLRRAAAFMQEARRTQAESGKVFGGANDLSLAQEHAIAAATAGSELVKAVEASVETKSPVSRLAERFEEMCRRQDTVVPGELRHTVVRLLAVELWVNQTALGIPAKKLIGMTLFQGAVGPELRKEFSTYINRSLPNLAELSGCSR